MAYEPVSVVEVRCWGICVGAVAPDLTRGCHAIMASTASRSLLDVPLYLRLLASCVSVVAPGYPQNSR